MTLTPNRAVDLGKSLAASSRPQNVVFSGLLVILVATIEGNFIYGLKVYPLLFALYAMAATLNNLRDTTSDKLNDRHDNPFVDSRLSTKRGALFTAFGFAAMVLLQFFLHQPQTLLLTIVYTALIISYSHKNINIQSRGLAAPIVLAICYGGIPLLLGASHIATAILGLAVLQIGLLAPLLLAKDYKDQHGDKLTNKLTFLVRHGAKYTQLIAYTVSSATVIISLVIVLSGKASVIFLFAAGACIYLWSVWQIHFKRGQVKHYYLRLAQAAVLGVNTSLLLSIR